MEMRSSGMEPDQSAEQQIARLTLLAEVRYLSAGLAVVREAAASLGLPAADVTGLDRAVHEVASNVIEHGFERGQRATFDLVVLRRPGQVVVAVEDAGLPFDFSSLEAGQGIEPGGAIPGRVRGCDPLCEPRGPRQSGGDRQAPAVHADRRARRRPAAGRHGGIDGSLRPRP